MRNRIRGFGIRNLFLIYGSILTFVGTIVVFFYSSDHFSVMFFIPLFYGLMTFVPFNLLKYMDASPAFIYFMIFTTIRYFIAPIITAFSGDYLIYYGRYTNSDHLFFAQIMLIFEMLVVYIVAHITLKKTTLYEQNEKEITFEHKSQFVLVVFIVFSILLLFVNPNLIKEYNFVFNIGPESSNLNDIDNFGLFSMVISTAKLLLPLVFIYYAKQQYNKTPRFRYVFVALVPSVLSTLFVQGMRRGALLTPLALLILIMVKVFDKHRRKILYIMGTFGLLIMLFLTFQKSLSSKQISLNSIQDQVNWLTIYLDSYFAFIKQIAASIDTKILFDNSISFKTFTADIFYPFPGIGGILFDGSNRSVVFYNYAFHGNNFIFDAVIPTIGQGFIYLGYVLSPAFSGLITYLSFKVDKSFRKANDVYKKYILGYLAWTLSSSIASNLNQLFKTAFQVILPLVLIYFIYKSIGVRKRKNRHI